MSLKAHHPSYAGFSLKWTVMRDAYAGQDQIKAKGEAYLPPTSGMVIDGMAANQVGRKNYEAYLARAVFPDYVTEGVEALIGLLHQKEAQILLPASMEYLREKATSDGESLSMLLRKINEEQLVPGRLGLLVDLPIAPDPAKPQPFISVYAAECPTNWDDSSDKEGINKLEMVVLDETTNVRDGFDWKLVEKYRVLLMKDGVYQQGVFHEDAFSEADMVTPMLRGSPLKDIPFVFVNSKDIIATPDKPPLLGLAQTCLSIYRGEADYRQNLHMQGQDTLVTVGGVRNPSGLPGEDDSVRIGAGSRIDVDIGGDAKFIGVGADGLSEQRQALENDRKRAEFRAGQLVGNQSIKNESGNAMLARLAAQTANLHQIALAGAEGLQTALRHIAVWLNEDPSKVKVTPNLEFTNAGANAQEIVYLLTAKSMGAMISMESIHSVMKDRGFTQLSYEDEVRLCKGDVMPLLSSGKQDPSKSQQ